MKRSPTGVVVALLASATLAVTVTGADTPTAMAASSDACDGGNYQVLGTSGATRFRGTVPAPEGTFRVQGTYNQFDVRASDFAILNYAFTGAPNEEDITGGRFTPVYESKIPDHRG